MTDPVQPSPMMTTSFLGSLRAMSLPLQSCRPFGATRDADRRQREFLVMAVDPVQIVVPGAGEADHFPRDHVAVAAVNRVGEEPHLYVVDHLREEGFAV